MPRAADWQRRRHHRRDGRNRGVRDRAFTTVARPALAMSDSGLGPLADLLGTWVGEGFSMVTGPGPDGHPGWASRPAATHEAIAFAPVGPGVERLEHERLEHERGQ